MAAVIVYHMRSSWLPGGFTGVDMFFVISGFVVTRSILLTPYESFVSFGTSFYARRVRRILPALVAFALTVAAIPLFIMPVAESHRSLTMGFMALFGISNLRAIQMSSDYFGMDAELNPYTHTWSLGVEEQFYVVFPALLILLYRPTPHTLFQPTGPKQSTQLKFLAVLFSSAILTIAVQHQPGQLAFYLMPTRFWELGIGVALAVWDAQQLPRDNCSTLRQSVFISFICVLATIGFALPFNHERFPVPLALPSVLATVLAIALGTVSRSSPLTRVLGSRFPTLIGKCSYSLYLWHWPVFVCFRWTVGLSRPLHFAAALILASACAAGSYRFIETPGRRWRAPTGRVLAIGFATLCASGGIMFCLMRPSTHELTFLGRADVQDDWRWLDNPISFDTGVWEPAKCSLRNDGEVGKPLLRSECTVSGVTVSQNEQRRRQRVVLLGNSFAEAALPIMRPLLAKHIPLEVSAYVGWGCPFGLDIAHGKPWSKSCRYYVEHIIPRALSEVAEGDIVFMLYDTAALTDHGPQPDWSVVASNEVNLTQTYRGLPSTPELRRDLFKQSLTNISRHLGEKNVSLVFFAPTPFVRGTNPRRCQVESFRPEETARSLCPVYSRQHHIAMREPIMAILREVRQQFVSFHVFDAFNALCPSEKCQWFDGGRPIWRDDAHLSEWKSEQLAGMFYEFLIKQDLMADSPY